MNATEYDPDAGGVGYLTWDEFDRFGRAVNNAQTHIGWWRIAGHISAGDPDEQRTRSNDPTIPLPSTWLAAEEITNLLIEINQWNTLEDVAKFGSEFALTLTREVETAMHRWPMSDRPHKVRFLRCRACGQMTLKYYPPHLSDELGSIAVPVNHPAPIGFNAVTNVRDVTVKCTNPDCRAIEDPKNFAHDAALIMEENEIAKRRVGNRKRSRNKNNPTPEDDLRVGESGPSEDPPTGPGAMALPA